MLQHRPPGDAGSRASGEGAAEEGALYIISVAARLVQMHPNTLRKYEREGYLKPARPGGKLRLYSARDVERLRQIKYLVEQRRVNLAGVELALELTECLRNVRAVLDDDLELFEIRRHLAARIEQALALLGADRESIQRSVVSRGQQPARWGVGRVPVPEGEQLTADR